MEYQSLEEISNRVTLLLKGPPGSGKTYLAAQLPGVVIINVDNNLSGLRKLSPEVQKNIKIVNPRMKDGKELDGTKVFDNMILQLKEVVEDPSIKTIVIDSLTTLADLIMDKIVGTSSPATAVQIQHYGEFTRYLKWFGDDFLCASDLDKNIVFIAHEQLIIDEITKETKYTLNMVTRMKDSFELYFTDCWRTYTKVPTAGDVQYRVRTQGGSNFTGKCSLELPVDFESKDQIATIIELFNR